MGTVMLLSPVAGVLALAVTTRKKVMDIANMLAASAMLAAGVVMTLDVVRFGRSEFCILNGFFHVDAVSIIFIDMVLLIGFLSGLNSTGYLGEEIKNGKLDAGNARTYYMLLNAFVFTMLLALSVKNMGVVWIAIEATTLASAFLVGFYNNRNAIEAAWKYVIICSVGIAMALLGIIFLHLSYGGIPGLENIQLDWTALYANADRLKTPMLKLGFIFILIGFGTKAGLAPMHTWLPDAHSQAPSPVSAMLSGVLLNSAMYAIIRTVSVLNRNMGSSIFSGRLLIAVGLVSMATAALFIITQKDYKRLLAYSSIEHMGIISLAAGIFTPASVFAALLHTVNHSLTKSMLFLSSGSVLLKYDTRSISGVKGVLVKLPATGPAMMLGVFAIAGMPPFSVFSSELYVIASAFQAGKYLLGVLVILFLVLVFSGMALAMLKMFFPGDGDAVIKAGEPGGVLMAASVLVLLAVITVTGLYMPGWAKHIMTDAQNIITGGMMIP